MRTSTGVWRALIDARRATAGDHARPAPTGVGGSTRRSVLKALGAAGLAGAAGSGGTASATHGGRVAIIGGGIAGLTALHHLREAGVDARLYEARSRLGGRIHTLRRGTVPLFERGGQFVNSDHHDIHALTRRFGIALAQRKSADHRALIVADGRMIDGTELGDALRGIAGQIDSDAARLDADHAGVAPEIDRISVADYLDRHRLLIRRPWVRHLLEATIRTEYGVEPQAASALELIFNLPVVDGERVDILGGSDESHVINGGSSRLIDAIAVRHGDAIETRRQAMGITARESGARVSFRDRGHVDVDRVIVAVPAPIARQIEYALPMTRDWIQFLATMQTGRNEKRQFALDEPVWRDGGREIWSADPAAASSLGWNGGVRGGGPTVWTWYLGGDQVDGDASPARLEAALAPALPGLLARRSGAFDATGWSRDPLTLGGYANFAPGMLTRFGHLLWLEDGDGDEGDARGTTGDGRILFAGEHLSDAYPGYMNGAAQTGRLAAASILDRPIPAQGI